MSKKEDTRFDIGFYESVLRRDPHFTDVIELLGGLYTKTGRLADGLKMDRKLVRLLPDNATAHYNLACSLALCKRTTEALRSLKRAVDLGYSDAEWMTQDPDLDVLKSNPAFNDLLTQLEPKN